MIKKIVCFSLMAGLMNGVALSPVMAAESQFECGQATADVL